ncbi:MAG: hypothetical protein NVSMB60_22000 [Mycobacterium sp.]
MVISALYLSHGTPPLVDGVLINRSAFTTHGLLFLDDPSPDAWARERFVAGDVDGLIDFRHNASGMPYVRPTIEHFRCCSSGLVRPATRGQSPRVIDGYWMGLAKRSVQLV